MTALLEMKAMLWLLPALTAAKFITTTITMSETESWRYFTKFAVDIGSGSYSMKAKFMKPQDSFEGGELPILLAVYLDSQWDEAMSQAHCRSKLRPSKAEKHLSLPASGDWSAEVSGTLTQRVRPYFWFFALAECNEKIHQSTRVRIEMNITNSDGSHFSLEEKNTEWMYLVAFVVFFVTLSSNVFRLIRRFRKSESLEGPLLMLNCAVASQMSSIFFQLIHLWVYSYDGRGVAALDFLSQAADLVCQLIISVMFILISMGWTIKYSEFPDVEIYVPVAFLITVLHLLTAGLGRISDDSYYKYTDYEGVAGVLLLLLRLCLFGWFAFSAKQLYRESHGTVVSTLWSLSLVATVYFLTVPVLAIISRGFAPYLRNFFLVAGTLIFHTGSFLALTRLLSDKSSYYKASTLNDSVLPGSKLR